jgi:hypothetical protein
MADRIFLYMSTRRPLLIIRNMCHTKQTRWLYALPALSAAALMVAACHSGTARHTSPGQTAAPAARTHTITLCVDNMTRTASAVAVSVDDKTVLQATVPPGARTADHAVPVAPGWHRVETRVPGLRPNTAMVQSDRDKWILIRRDQARADGIGVHVTESPVR